MNTIYNKITVNSETLIDISSDTVDPNHHLRNGYAVQRNANTTFSNHIQINKLINIILNKNQVVTVKARARGTNYYMYVSNLTIQQTV